MPISGFLKLSFRSVPAPASAPMCGCSKEAAALLQTYLTEVIAGRTPTAMPADLLRAIEAAKVTLPDPCTDERLVTHLTGMSGLLGLMQASAPLTTDIKRVLPNRANLERDMASTAERAFRKIAVQVYGLREAARINQVAIAEPLKTSLLLLNRLSALAQSLRDGATTFAAFSAANGVGRHAAREALAIAESLGEEDNAGIFSNFDVANMRTSWVDIDASARLAAVTGVQKERQVEDDGSARTVRKRLSTSSGHVYELEAPLTDRTGAHGRVHSALAEPGPEGILIVKVQRTQRKLIGKQEVLDAPLDELLQKAAAAKVANARVNAGLEAHAGLFEGHDAALRNLDAREASAAIFAHFIDASGKYYQVMPAMAGDLADVSRALSAEVDADVHLELLVADARLSVASQAFVQLEGLHRGHLFKDNGVAHLDLKLPNIVFNSEGIVRLIDFDESKMISTLGHARHGSYIGGSLPSPERDNPALQKRGGTLGKPYDIWCLGAAMLELGSPTFNEQTPTGPKAVSAMLDSLATNAPRGFSTAEWFAVYADFWELNIRGKGPLQAVPLKPSPTQKVQILRRLRAQSEAANGVTDTQLGVYLDDCFARLSRFINQRLQVDQELTSLLLRQALVPQPARRASAKQLAGTLTGMMADQSDAQRLKVLQMFTRLAASSPLANVR